MEPWSDCDLLIDRILTHDEIAAGLAALFQVDPDAIAVTDDVARLAIGRPIRCVVSTLAGEFPCQLALFTTTEMIDSVAAAVGRLCRTLACRCLKDDGTPNPYTYLLFDGHTIHPISLDAEKFDRDEIVIARRRG